MEPCRSRHLVAFVSRSSQTARLMESYQWLQIKVNYGIDARYEITLHLVAD